MLHVVAFPLYKHVYRLRTEREFKAAIRDCVNCSFALYTELQLLHRDVSSENLMWDPDEKCGILNDYDLAKLVQEMQFPTTAKHKTGTLPFMARKLLQGWDGEHFFEFELESYLFVVMWISLRYEDGREVYRASLKHWLSKDPMQVFKDKQAIFTDPQQVEAIPWEQSKTFPTVYESWILPILGKFSKLILQVNVDAYANALAKLSQKPKFRAESSGSGHLFHKEIVDIFNSA